MSAKPGQLQYTSCTFNKSASSADSSAIVFIDTNGQGNGQINDIEFSNCSVYSQAGLIELSGLYCYKITSGSNIRIIGGTASNAGPGTATAGIAVVPTVVPGGPAGPGRITVLGVDLTPTYPQAGGGGAQEYALFISANLQDVMTVDDCRMSGYTNPPVRVTGTVTGNLYIRNCQGYNDQNTTILSGTSHLPISSAVSAGNASTLSGGSNYYGPSLVMFTNSSTAGGVTFSVNGVSQTVPAGGFVTVYLASPWDTIQFSHSLAAFVWIGK